MPASLLDSQFAILEEPDLDEDPICADVGRLVEDIVAEIVRDLDPSRPRAAPSRAAATLRHQIRSSTGH